jgi:hypothetical protein
MTDKKVFNFAEHRKKNIETKRRQFERVMFDELLGVYTVIDDQGTGYPIKLLDVSKEGCLFQFPMSTKAKKQFGKDTEVTLKLYFTKNSYLPAVVTIKHGQEFIDDKGNAYWRCGGVFDTTLPTYKALSKFIQFITEYAEFSCVDNNRDVAYFL